jgi:hypothetical protein
MITVLTLLIAALAFVSLCGAGLIHERRQLADRAQRRAMVRWQQRQAERQLQYITQAAFDTMLTEARQQQSPSGSS